VCWDLLNFLDDSDRDAFTVRGRYPALTPVDLPLWLPHAALKFEQHGTAVQGTLTQRTGQHD
jgi:hypothetical protein